METRDSLGACHCTPAHLEDAYRQGARAFIAKPYDPHELLATITGVLESRAKHAH